MGIDVFDLVELSGLTTVEAITQAKRKEPFGKEYNNFLISWLSTSFWVDGLILTVSL